MVAVIAGRRASEHAVVDEWRHSASHPLQTIGGVLPYQSYNYLLHSLSFVGYFQRPTATTGDLDQLCTRYVAAHQVLERTLW